MSVARSRKKLSVKCAKRANVGELDGWIGRKGYLCHGNLEPGAGFRVPEN